MSASGSERLDACPSSQARILQILDFAEQHNVHVSDESAAAGRGNLYHDYLQLFPIFSAKHAIGKAYSPSKRLEQLMAQSGDNLANIDKRFILGALKKRSEFVDTFFDFAQQKSGSRIESVFIDLDANRLHGTFGLKQYQSKFSGLADVRIHAVMKNGERYGAIIDYKSGNSHTVVKNKQLRSLLVLLNKSVQQEYGQGLQGGLVTIIDTDAINGSRQLHADYYSSTAIEQADLAVNRMIARNAQMISTNSDDDLDQQARFGKHCLYCQGKANCGVLLDEMKSQRLELERFRGELTALESIGDSVDQIYGQAMELTQKAAIFDRLKVETQSMVESLVENDQVSDLVELKDGRSNFKIVPELQLPSDLYRHLKGYLPGISEEQFFDTTCDLDPNKLKQYLRDQHDLSGAGCVEVLNQLETSGLIDVRQNQPTIRRR